MPSEWWIGPCVTYPPIKRRNPPEIHRKVKLRPLAKGNSFLCVFLLNDLFGFGWKRVWKNHEIMRKKSVILLMVQKLVVYPVLLPGFSTIPSGDRRISSITVVHLWWAMFFLDATVETRK